MSDPLERMAGFRSEVEGGPMLAADEVRRRGDRIRRRRRTAIAAGSALAVAAIAIPIALVTTGGSPDRIDPAPPPSPSVTDDASEAPGAATLSEANLLRDQDTVLTDEVRWQRAPGADDPATCHESSLADLGAAATLDRSWWVDSGIHSLTQLAAEFPSGAEARDAYDEISTWLADCTPAGASEATTAALAESDVPVDGEVTGFRTTYRLDGEEGGEAFNDHLLISGIVVSGNRLTVLSHDMPDGAEVAVPGSTPVERMVPTAAERLVEAEPPTDGDTGTTTPPDAADVLDDSHLVEAGALPAVPDREPWERVASQPVPTLICQGGWLSSLEPTDTVTRELRIPEPRADYDLGMVNVAVLAFAEQETADAAYGTVTGWLERCPASQQDAAEPRVDTPAAAVDVPGADRAHQVRVDYVAPEVCPDGGCDAAWFDHQTVAQIGDRLVLVTYAELAGPCPPGDACPETEQSVRPWFDRVAAAVEAAVGRAVP